MAESKLTEAKPNMPSQDVASAAYLMASPFAGAVAMSTLGIGLAGQAFGFWAGMMSGMAKASQPVKVLASVEVERSASIKARTAAKALIEETQSAALEIAGSAVTPAPEAATELQPEDFRRPNAMPKPRKADDLKAISGIGPKLEKVLHGLGVWTYAQIAAWSAEEIAWVDDYLSFHGRIGRDGWIEQAAALASRRNGAKSAS